MVTGKAGHAVGQKEMFGYQAVVPHLSALVGINTVLHQKAVWRKHLSKEWHSSSLDAGWAGPTRTEARAVIELVALATSLVWTLQKDLFQVFFSPSYLLLSRIQLREWWWDKDTNNFSVKSCVILKILFLPRGARFFQPHCQNKWFSSQLSSMLFFYY